MPTAEELLVAIRSEGVDETRGDLEGVEQSMENTAETAGDSAEQLEGFSEQFQGAMTAAVAALAVGVAGLASQVPVLGGLFSSVKAVVSAVAFQMDQVLRPVLQPLTQGFFKLSAAIMDMDGAAGDAIGIVASIVSAIVGIGAAVGAVAVQIFGFSTVWGAVSSAVGTAVSAIVGFIGGIPLAIAAAIAAIVGFAVAYLTNFKGIRDTTNRIIGQVVDFVVDGFMSLASTGLKIITDFLKFVVDRFFDFLSFLGEFASQVVTKAGAIGAAIVDGIVQGIQALSSVLLGVVENLINRVIGLINDVLEIVPDKITSELGFSELDKISLGGGVSAPSIGQDTVQDRINLRTGTGGSMDGAQIDGRQLTESTGRYRADPSRRRNI
jgi:hypothetical protein